MNFGEHIKEYALSEERSFLSDDKENQIPSDFQKQNNHLNILKSPLKMNGFLKDGSNHTVKVLEDLSDMSQEESKERDCVQQTEMQFDDIVMIELLGKGAFGEVHRIFNKTTKEFCALKLLQREKEFDDQNAKREYLALERVRKHNNPALLRVIRLNYKPNQQFQALLEYGQGTLADFQKYLSARELKWGEKDILNLYFQLLDQAKELKKIGLCHRDIKPANIIISEDGRFKLADFGLAIVLKGEGVQEMRISGTPKYMPPVALEALQNQKCTCMIDPYDWDVWTIKMTISSLLNKKGTIDDLLQSHKEFQRRDVIQTYKEHQEGYKMARFEQLYKDLSLEEKSEKLHIFIDYYNHKKIAKWLKNKTKGNTDKDELQLVYFLIGEIFRAKGESQKAMIFYRKSEGLIQNPKSKQTAHLYSAMGVTERNHFCLESAREYFKKSLEIKLSVLGKYSYEVAEEYTGLGLIDSIEGDFQAALNFYQKALHIYKKLLGLQHGNISEAGETKKLSRETLFSLGMFFNSLGIVYCQLQRVEESFGAYEESLAILQKVFAESPQIGKTLVNIGLSHVGMNQQKEALEFLEKGVSLISKNTKTDPFIFRIMFTIIEVSLSLKDYQKAKKYLFLCIKGYEEISPENHYKVGYAWIFLDCNLKRATKQERNERLEKLKENPAKHDEIGMFKRQLGFINIVEEKYEDALKLLFEALTITQEAREEAYCLFLIGRVYFERKNFEDARKYYIKSLEAGGNKIEVDDCQEIQENQDYLNLMTYEQFNYNS